MRDRSERLEHLALNYLVLAGILSRLGRHADASEYLAKAGKTAAIDDRPLKDVPATVRAA